MHMRRMGKTGTKKGRHGFKASHMRGRKDRETSTRGGRKRGGRY